jgi:hypothetical protein
MGEMRNACKFWAENLKEGNHLQDPEVDVKIILKWFNLA